MIYLGQSITKLQVLVVGLLVYPVLANPLRSRGVEHGKGSCRKTQVAVLGAGVAGITAGKALANNSITDFVIVEYNSEIGGRCRHGTFGKSPDGSPYTIELGANWIQGTQSPGGPSNPIWELSGPVDFLEKIDAFEEAYAAVEYDAGEILTFNYQDRSFRAALNLAGWKPSGDAQAMAVEWYEMDYEYANTPDVSSQEFTIANFNSTYYGFSEVNNFVFDPRGYNAFLHGLASEYLSVDDDRLLLETIVTNITWSDDGVTVHNKDGSCIDADFAITTFSIGVLQSGDVTFEPELPSWKKIAINTMEMGVYTKIFLQFAQEDIFWDQATQFFLYASPTRGYYPVWQNLDHPMFLPGSGIFFVTVVTDQSHVVDHQDDATTLAQIMAALREMFGADRVRDPIDFMYPRWSTTPWAYGSYSNWPPGLTLEGHQNLRASVGRLYFAGEATSPEFYGYLHGAYFEGKDAADTVAACINGANSSNCTGENHYEVLMGTTSLEEYNSVNGWEKTSFQTIGDVGLEGGGG